MVDPVRKRFYGDTNMAQAYIKDALNLLGFVKDQMGYNKLSQLSRQIVLASGVVLFAASVFGQDEIRIHVPVGGQSVVKTVREYCVWGADGEIYSPPVPVYGAGAGMDSGKTNIYVAGSSFDGPVKTFILDADTVQPVANFEDGDTAATDQPGGMFADTKNDRFGIITYDPYFTGHSLVQGWGVERNLATTFDASDELNSGFSLNQYSSLVEDFGATNSGMYALSGGDDTTPGNNFWWVLDTAKNAVLREITNPPFRVTDEGGAVETRAMPSDGGDMLFVSVPVGGDGSTIYQYGVQSGNDSSYEGPPGLLSASDFTEFFGWAGAVQNDNDTIWMRVSNQGAPGDDTLYTRTGGIWVPAPAVEGGFGSFGAVTNSTTLGVMHDNISDAIAVLMGDLSGVWIFNARDCLNVGIEPFFFPFKSPPTDKLDTNVTVYKGVFPGTFYDGTLIIGYQTADGMIVGRYDIGRLKQTKVTEEEPN